MLIYFKNIFCVLLIGFSIGLKAQTNKKYPTVFLNYNSTESQNYPENKLPFQTDTIKPASFAMSCYTNNPSDSLILYYADVKVPHDSGYVTGTNIYGDLEKAQHFVNTTSTTLTGCAVLLKRAYSGTTTTYGTKVKLYTYTAGAPTTSVIISSGLTPQNTLTNGLNVFTFSVPIVISTDFVMSVVLPNHDGDTTAIFSTLTSCNSGGSNSWERAIDNSWGSIHNNWAFSASQNIDLAIFPLKQGVFITEVKTNAIEDNFIYDGINNIIKTKNNTSPLRITVCDLVGKVVLNQELQANQIIDLSYLKYGIYIVNIIANDGYIFRKKIMVNQSY